MLNAVRPSQISDDCFYNSLCSHLLCPSHAVTCYEAIEDTRRMKQMNNHRHRALPPKEGLLSFCIA